MEEFKSQKEQYENEKYEEAKISLKRKLLKIHPLLHPLNLMIQKNIKII